MKYIILANSNDKKLPYPRQLAEINGEPLIVRTIRLLKENGVDDILIIASDERFDKFGIEIYVPKNSDYDYQTGTGYWLNAFPFELINEPVCFIWGDVYFSENAMKIIVSNESENDLFFCTYKNKDSKYIKHHDEPLAYKVMNTKLFKDTVNKVKRLKDEKVCCRDPIIWEVYRVMHDIYVNDHILRDDVVVINDESCDIDCVEDLKRLKERLEVK